MKPLSFLIICTILSCSGSDNPDTLSSDSAIQLPAEDSAARIERLKRETEDLIDSIRVETLKQFQEPELSDSGATSYRFSILDHETFLKGMHIYRIYSDSSGYRFIHKYFQLNQYHQRDSLIVISGSIRSNEWWEVERLVKGAYFWSLEKNDIGQVGLADDLWILEGRNGGRYGSNNKSYHIVRRWDPYEGSFKSACLKIQEVCEK